MTKRPHCDHNDNDNSEGASFTPQEYERFRKAMGYSLASITTENLQAILEPMIRRVVREEMEGTLQRCFPSSSTLWSSRPIFDGGQTSRRGGLKLQFMNKPPSPIFTNNRIISENGDPIRIVLLNVDTEAQITTGPFSSMKVVLVALDGDFGSEDDQENWTDEEFKANIPRPRDGKRPLVAGEVNITLTNGIGYVREAFFTDNSSWLRSRKFRLGAQPSQSVGEVMIRGARSEAFVVKDHRGESYKKHYPPRLADEVWRLKSIAKDGANHLRLASHNINNVKQFLQYYHINPSGLRNICKDGLKDGISNKSWEAVIAHAITCVVDDGMLYQYHDSNSRAVLVLNSVYEVVRVAFDGQTFETIDLLTPHQLVLLENLKRQAYSNVNQFVLIADLVYPGLSRSLPSIEAQPYQDPNLGLNGQLEYQLPHQEQMQTNFNDPPCSATFAYDTESVQSINSHEVQLIFPVTRNSFKFDDFCLGEPSYNYPSSLVEDISHVQSPKWTDGLYGVHMSRSRKSKAWWSKLRAALLFSSIRRSVAARRFKMVYPSTFRIFEHQ